MWIGGTLAAGKIEDFVPALGLQFEGGEALLARVNSTPGLVGTIELEYHFETIMGNNLIATSKEGDQDSVVFLGAHLDSVATGPVSSLLENPVERS